MSAPKAKAEVVQEGAQAASDQSEPALVYPKTKPHRPAAKAKAKAA